MAKEIDVLRLRKEMEVSICNDIARYNGTIWGEFLFNEYAKMRTRDKITVEFIETDTTAFLESLKKNWNVSDKKWIIDLANKQAYSVDVINQYSRHAEPIVITLKIVHKQKHQPPLGRAEERNIEDEYGYGTTGHFDIDLLHGTIIDGQITEINTRDSENSLANVILNCRERKFFVLNRNELTRTLCSFYPY